MNELPRPQRPRPASAVPRAGAVGAAARCLAAALAVATFGAGAVAADLGRPGIPGTPPGIPRLSVAGREQPVATVERDVLLARRSPLSIFGRDCLPGFAPDEGGACFRHDDPKLSCGSATRRPGCAVLPPDPAPYGIGAASRLDY